LNLQKVLVIEKKKEKKTVGSSSLNNKGRVTSRGRKQSQEKTGVSGMTKNPKMKKQSNGTLCSIKKR